MRIYVAAVYTTAIGRTGMRYRARLSEVEKQVLGSYPWILESYHYIGHAKSIMRAIQQEKPKLFVDSGAFSSFTKGIDVDLDRYCTWLKENEEYVSVASVLDAIGDAAGTWENQQAMESNGLSPLPCFHYGEPIEYLKRYIDRYEYITLGGMVPISTQQLYYWLDEIWGKWLTDDKGQPRIKVHGFGLTSLPLMMRYPWFSVDSSSWVMAGKSGAAYFVGAHNRMVPISDRHPHAKLRGSWHFDRLLPEQQNALRQEAAERGWTIEDIKEKWWSRIIFNIEFFARLEKHINDSGGAQVFRQEIQTLF